MTNIGDLLGEQADSFFISSKNIRLINVEYKR
jgi:hypothetical protein